VEAGASAGYTELAFPPDRKRIDIGDYYANGDSIRQTLGWQPRTSLREGLAQTMAYFKQYFDHYV
jgi:nucleoside-diphosphate-sugar epimerase